MKLPENINTRLLEADLNKMAKIFCTAAMNKSTELICKFAFDYMQNYYASYTPWLYKRTGMMLGDGTGEGHSSYKQYKDRVENIEYRGGIIISSSFTNHPIKGISEDELYSGVWEQGLHGRIAYADGNRLNYGKDGGPRNRLKELEKKAYSSQTKKEVQDYAMNRMHAGKYNLIHF